VGNVRGRGARRARRDEGTGGLGAAWAVASGPRGRRRAGAVAAGHGGGRGDGDGVTAVTDGWAEHPWSGPRRRGGQHQQPPGGRS